MPFRNDRYPVIHPEPQPPWLGAAICAAAVSLALGSCVVATLAAWM